MKKIVLFLSMLFLLVPASAQNNTKDLDKMLNDALSRGVSSDGFYLLSNPKQKIIMPGEAKPYLQAKGFRINNVTTKRYNRFGTMVEIIDNIEFYSKDYDNLIAFNALNEDPGISFNQLKQGSFIFVTRERYQPYQYLKKDGAYWSGSIVDGDLHGSGIGLFDNNGQWTYFTTSFLNGIPVQPFLMKTVAYDKWGHLKPNNERGYYISDISGLAPESNGYFKTALQKYARNNYEADSNIILREYEKALSLNSGTNKSLTLNRKAVDDYNNLYGSVCPGTDIDYLKCIPKVKELKEVITVLDVLNKEFNDNYIVDPLFTSPYFDKEAIERDREFVSDGMVIAQLRGYNGDSQLKPFFAAAVPLLYQKDKALENHIEKMTIAWNNYADRYNAEQRTLAAKENAAREAAAKELKYSATVHLSFSDGTVPEGSSVTVYFNGTSGKNSKDVSTDNDGNLNVRWADENGEKIIGIYLKLELLKHMAYYIDDLDIKDGEFCSICLDCK